MILGVFIEFFGVKIDIDLSKNHCDLILTIGFDLSQNSRYISDISDILPIYLRYFTYISPIFYRYIYDIYRYISDIYRYFTDIFSEIPAHARVRRIIEISPKYWEFSIFRRYLCDFFDFSPILWPTDYRLAILFRSPPIINISVIFRPKKPKFCSLAVCEPTSFEEAHKSQK